MINFLEKYTDLKEEITLLKNQFKEKEENLVTKNEELKDMIESYKNTVVDNKSKNYVFIKIYIAALHQKQSQMIILNNKITQLTQENSKLSSNSMQELNTQISKLKSEHSDSISKLNSDHSNLISSTKSNYEKTIATLKSDHSKAISNLHSAHSDATLDLKSAHSDKILEIQSENLKKLSEAKEEFSKVLKNHELENARLSNESKLNEDKINDLTKQLENTSYSLKEAKRDIENFNIEKKQLLVKQTEYIKDNQRLDDKVKQVFIIL